MNKWKVAFLVLTGALLIAVVAIVYLATADVKQAELSEPLELEGNVLSVETTAKEFESIAKQYLGASMNNSPLPVELVVEDKIYLYSTMTVFNVDVPIQMDFNPVVSEGNIVLRWIQILLLSFQSTTHCLLFQAALEDQLVSHPL